MRLEDDITVALKACGCVTQAGFHVKRCPTHPLHPDYVKYASPEDPRCSECGRPWPNPEYFHRCYS